MTQGTPVNEESIRGPTTQLLDNLWVHPTAQQGSGATDPEGVPSDVRETLLRPNVIAHLMKDSLHKKDDEPLAMNLYRKRLGSSSETEK